MVEASNVADFGDEPDRRDKRDAAQRLERVHDRCPPPSGGELPELVGEPLDAAFGLVDRVAVLLQRDVLRGEGKTEIGQPPTIRPSPSGTPWIAAALPEQERFQAMFGLGAQADGIFPRADEIAQRFVVGRRDVDRGELAGAMQPGERVAIAPIGLDPIAAALRHARGIDDLAVLPLGGELAMDPKPARAGLIHEAQPPLGARRARTTLATASRSPAITP